MPPSLLHIRRCQVGELVIPVLMAHWLTEGREFNIRAEFNTYMPVGEDAVFYLYDGMMNFVAKMKEDLIRRGMWDPRSHTLHASHLNSFRPCRIKDRTFRVARDFRCAGVCMCVIDLCKKCRSCFALSLVDGCRPRIYQCTAR